MSFYYRFGFGWSEYRSHCFWYFFYLWWCLFWHRPAFYPSF